MGIGANTTSIRHTYLRADEGTSYIEESARQFKIWGQGETGKRRLTSTALGDSEVSQNKTAKVDVQGKVTAGIHNKLDIDITGNLALKGSTAADAAIDTSKVKVTRHRYQQSQSHVQAGVVQPGQCIDADNTRE